MSHALEFLDVFVSAIFFAHRFGDFLSERKYIHPLMRGVYISENKVLMQLPVANEIIPSPLWDSFLSNHISVNETAQKCLEKTALEYYNLEGLKTFYLTKYMLETPFEYQYTL